jgi:FkbM family methyltransferase
MGRLGGMLKRRWDERLRYPRKRDWLWSLYGRLLRRSGSRLPFAGRVRGVQVRGADGELHVRLGTTDWLVLEEIYFKGEYDGLFAHDLGDVRTVVDLGANVGLSIRLWLSKFPGARVLGVEPDAANAAVAARNIGADAARVQLVHACVAATPGTVTLDRREGEWAFTMRDAASGGGPAIPALTIPQLLDQFGVDGPIDLLKCDVEGAERDLFADCAGWIGRFRNLVVELHRPYDRDAFLADVRRGGGSFVTHTLQEDPAVTVLLLRSTTGDHAGG